MRGKVIGICARFALQHEHGYRGRVFHSQRFLASAADKDFAFLSSTEVLVAVNATGLYPSATAAAPAFASLSA